MKETFDIATHSPEQTFELGRRIGAFLRGGETLSLIGDLGAGKTLFTQGLAKGLGAAGEVVSPTFLIHRIYQGRLRLHHFDFYRLAGESDLESIGFYDFQAEDPPAVIAIEWGDRFPRALDEPILQIEFHTGASETDRRIAVRAKGVPMDEWRTLVDKAGAP
ncbi:MAG: tRNA (adenosine(37)-N6)-threonylcarbamoyltransferase complex ATPase subunit type 1 TsaE [Candidatus Sumerlaeota bacterium]|nr:tRNA (adenosine(37)-N6)-threonylcarbamoyltransferase complex ATPase subunit type 1 TsaE [Candidatus Sumerlaeota bacterium]